MPSFKNSIKPASRATASQQGPEFSTLHSLSQPAVDPLREAGNTAPTSGSVAPKFIQPSQSPAPPADRDMFAALDSSTSPTPAWIHASPHHAEAGYLDPSLGWVSVRADAGSAGTHAAIVPGSALAASILGDHLAGLNTFLSEHNHAATVTLAPHAPTSNSDASPLGNGLNNQGHDQQPDHNTAPGGHGSSSATLAGGNEATATRSATPQSAAALPPGNGVYLSVLA
jgi:hypothetical protein